MMHLLMQWELQSCDAPSAYLVQITAIHCVVTLGRRNIWREGERGGGGKGGGVPHLKGHCHQPVVCGGEACWSTHLEGSLYTSQWCVEVSIDETCVFFFVCALLKLSKAPLK